ncbi:MAG: efflux RND transporter periplasmic adaptor subunit [Sulfurimonas sp.]|uniref:efflux RND transporter periplasmic adaptor subunit n=1 Tax=Sulfurimonas sp. TaxID=2022749 RepID=UPI0025EDECCB|nr:HlyD family efflux transporter periplasmic adaptor subunit [Sulfurimonas sp.]MCK9491252.1 efflux RND transporter periplasmic adaptor subunit [Sulfurimonas sp.]
MSAWIKYSIGAIVIALGIIVFYNKVYVTKSTFSTTKPVYGDLFVSVKGIGNVDAKNIYTITAQSGGKIEKIFFDEGEWVKKGDLLLSIDPVDLPMLLDEQRVALKKATHEVHTSQSNLESLEAQESLILVTNNRYKKLLEDRYATQAEFDKAHSDLQNMRAQMDSAKAKIASAKLEIQRLAKTIEATEEKLKRLKIYAPSDGYIVSKDAELAQYVLPSTPIFKIVDPKTLWVVVNVDERLAHNIKLGQDASIVLRSKPDEKLQGVVERVVAISNAVTLEREIAVAFSVTPSKFYINEQAEVNIKTAKHENVLKVPLTIMRTKESKKGLWVVKENKAYFTPVTVLAQNDDEVAISSGISVDSELLIHKNSNKPLSDGMKIFR